MARPLALVPPLEAGSPDAIVPDPDHSTTAELEALLSSEVLAGLDPLALVDALRRVGQRCDVGTSTTNLAMEAIRIALGRSSVAPAERDWRFQHRAWHDNPMFRRLAQGYLAWSAAVEQLVEEADLDWRTAERARFAAGLVTSTLAPTNFLATNPAAIERAVQTGGRSLVRGMRNIVRDVVENRGMPRSVDLRPFRLGETIAATPGSVVYRDEVLELLQYRPTTPRVHSRPVVVVPPQINKYYFLDLAPGRSFVEFAVAQGHQTFCISWRNPTAEQHDWDFDTYVAALEGALVAAAEIAGADRVNTVSMCAGGIATAALLAHHAATGTDLIGSATFGVTLLDFDLPSGIAMLASQGIVEHSLRTTRESGVLDGHSLFAFFSALRPNDLVWNYWVNNNLLGDDPPAFDVLAWNQDSARLPAGLHADFLDLFMTNRLAKAGEMTVLGRPVDLGAVECDTFVVGAQTDHLTPWKACYASTQLFGGRSEFVLSSSGHIQSLVNPPANPKMRFYRGPRPPGSPEGWLADATSHTGSWWEPWATWVGDRGGADRAAPRSLGNRKHRPDGPAPGTYVLAS
jgi:polyhydroxyalkanoate synthase